MTILVYIDYTSRGGSLFKRNFEVHYSCDKVMAELGNQIPGNWMLNCNKNNLQVEIDETKKAELENSTDKNSTLTLIYQDLAQQLTYIATKSPTSALLATDIVTLRIHYPKVTLNAATEGKFMHQLVNIKDEKLIADHLRSTVQVQEVWK